MGCHYSSASVNVSVPSAIQRSSLGKKERPVTTESQSLCPPVHSDEDVVPSASALGAATGGKKRPQQREPSPTGLQLLSLSRLSETTSSTTSRARSRIQSLFLLAAGARSAEGIIHAASRAGTPLESKRRRSLPFQLHHVCTIE